MRTLIAGFILVVFVPALGAAPAFARTYPGKPIRILIAQAPGSATDVISRVVGNRLYPKLPYDAVDGQGPGPARFSRVAKTAGIKVE